MKLFGYLEGEDDAEQPRELREVTFSVSAFEVRELISFFERALAVMEQQQDAFGHEHLSMTGRPQVIIAAERAVLKR